MNLPTYVPVASAPGLGRGGYTLVVLALTVAVALLSAPVAHAAVSVTKASLVSGSLEVEGTGARPEATITVTSPESTATGRADDDGRFRIRTSGFRSSTCKATVGDGSSSVTVSLSGCTPTSTSSSQITPIVDALGPGYVGSDFTTFSDTTTTMTFGPDTLGPVRWEIISGRLPAGLGLEDPNACCTPAKSIHASVVGTPTTAETTTFTIKATDANGLQATRTYSITIHPARTLEMTPEPWAPLTVGDPGNLWIDGSGGVKPYRWAHSAGQLPTGMSLIQDNPDGYLVRVGGTPTTAGTFTFTIRLTDAQGSTVSRTFTVTVS